MRVSVLLSTYNGEKYLEQQLESLFNQTLKDIEIFVRDDGSTDNTISILKKYEKQGLLKWYPGKNLGCTRSFWELLNTSSEADYYAFCDQDDYWDKDKLEIAVKEIKKHNRISEKAILYFSDVRVTDENLNVIRDKMVEVIPEDYAHALIRNLSPGCTFVFNKQARNELIKYPVEYLGNDIHDWCAYRIIASIGEVLFDRETHMSYRQHGNNVVGANGSMIKTVQKALRRVFNLQDMNRRSCFAHNLIKIYSTSMSDENLEISKDFAYYKESYKRKINLMVNNKYKIEIFRSVYFSLLVLLNRV